jgi:hypothetical protein
MPALGDHACNDATAKAGQLSNREMDDQWHGCSQCDALPRPALHSIESIEMREKPPRVAQAI